MAALSPGWGCCDAAVKRSAQRYSPFAEGSVLDLLDAVHVVPKSAGGSDHPANGLVLCAPHHGAFDEGMFAFEPGRLAIRYGRRGLRAENSGWRAPISGICGRSPTKKPRPGLGPDVRTARRRPRTPKTTPAMIDPPNLQA